MQKRILLVADSTERRRMLTAAVAATGDVVAGNVDVADDLAVAATRVQPDAVVAWVAAPAAAVRRQFQMLVRSQPLPVALFADRATATDIQQTVRAGINALAVDGFRPERVGAVLEVALARFSEMAAWRTRCERAEIRLQERERIERAKGIIMRRRNLPEAAAFAVLRQMARERRRRIPEVAESVVSAEEMLAQSCTATD
jgi:two-component system, response regulator / RNA-binding antiterminator